MKPLVSVVALLLGLGALVATITIQQNPYAFTRLDRSESAVLAEIAVPVRAVELPVSIEAQFPGSTSEVVLDDVVVEGKLKEVARPMKVSAPKSNEVDEVEITVIPAPCVDGEYRMLEEQRGVRLMCPGGSL